MKKVLAAIAVFVLALAGIVFALPLALGSDSLRTALARQLSAASGSEISLAGPVRFSVFPDFGIVADDVAYVSGDGSVSVAAARTVASVRVMSLLSDRMRITGVQLENPRVTLSKGKGGEAEASAGPTEERDLFRLAAAYLEKLAIDRVGVSNGQIVEDNGSGARVVASGIDLGLSVPGIDEPASLVFSGIVGGRKVKLAGEIGSLRDILDRRPAEFSLSAEMASPPHPALAILGATGHIQLAKDGSYRIAGGKVTSAGQPMRFDATYVPGARPFVSARIKAGALDYADFEPAGQTADVVGNGGVARNTRNGGPDFSALRDVDVDFELQADALQAGNAVARGLVLQAVLQNGKLQSTISSQQIAGGELQSGVFADFNDATPEITGYINLLAIDIESLTKLAGRHLPAAGRLTSKLQYAFRGTDETAIRNTINLKGTVAVKDGVVDIPWLAEVAGPGAGRIAALDAKAEVTDISKPVAVSGTMNWNGENVGSATSIALVDLLSGRPGAVAVDLKSRPVDAKFSGTVALDGGAKGKAVIETASLSRLLRWVGQDAGTPLGRFSYVGAITARTGKLVLNDARIALDDMKAAGSASVTTAGKPAIRAALSVNALDFAKFAGGGERAGKSPSGSASSAAIDLTVLRQFDADIRLKAGRIGYGQVKAGPATAMLTVKDGIARLSVPRAGFYGGAVAADFTANGAGKVPAIELDARLKGVNALPFLTDAAAFKRIEGKLDAELAVKGNGANADTISRSLVGKARVVFSNGALRGIDVARLVNNLQSLIKGGYRENAEDRTKFTELSVSYDITGGVARTEDLQLLGPLVRMDGSGSVDLAAQSIDMRLNPRVVGSLDGQGGEFDVAGLGLPVIVNGPLSRPRIYPDISNILANPEQALHTLSRLGGGIGKLAKGASDASGVLKKTFGNEAGAAVNDAVSGVIGRLNTSNGENGDSGGGPAGTNDLVGSLLQGVLGPSARLEPADRPENQKTPRRQQGPSNLETRQPDAGPPQGSETGIAPIGSGREPTVVLPTSGVPIPTPNPRRQASATNMPAQKPGRLRNLADQAVDLVAPKIAPEGAQDNAADLIKGLIKQMGD